MTVIDLGLPRAARSAAAGNGPSAAAPARADGPLIDTFGRVATDLRVSVTDRCNLRCTYCMPADGLDWLPSDDLLTTAEFIRVLTIAVRDLGVRRIRFTGGEPLLRRDLEKIIGALAGLADRPELTLTTNGLGLAHRAKGLAAAGLDRINVSLDTIDRARYAEITRRDRLPSVLDGLAAARAAGLDPVKVNAVLPSRADLDALPDLLAFTLAQGYQLRIIEAMPLDADHRWDRTTMVTADEILAALRSEYTLDPDPAPRGNAPAATWLVRGYTDRSGRPARVGVIAAVTRPFCGDCDRTRLTADGALRNCLFTDTETSLIRPLRSGGTDAEIATLWRSDTWRKKAGHGMDSAHFHQPRRPMSAIGG
ncbi:MAG: GTP 3',8-cyclase MoaA [Gordonia sp. (in: high G+C Gram-positive bacteria)]